MCWMTETYFSKCCHWGRPRAETPCAAGEISGWLGGCWNNTIIGTTRIEALCNACRYRASIGKIGVAMTHLTLRPTIAPVDWRVQLLGRSQMKIHPERRRQSVTGLRTRSGSMWHFGSAVELWRQLKYLVVLDLLVWTGTKEAVLGRLGQNKASLRRTKNSAVWLAYRPKKPSCTVTMLWLFQRGKRVLTGTIHLLNSRT